MSRTMTPARWLVSGRPRSGAVACLRAFTLLEVLLSVAAQYERLYDSSRAREALVPAEA